MSYSFFGTCSNDQAHFLKCLDSMIFQEILPKEIILVDSGDKNFKKEIQKRIKRKPIKLVYIFKKLSRVKALNIALKKSTSEFSFRFDSRSRFSTSYAKKALEILNKKSIDAKVTGGSPTIINELNNFQSILCTGLIQRPYVFFYPNHRRLGFSGYSSSVYLGCFDTKIIQKIRYREVNSLISEDSLIISDFLKNGYKTYISSEISVSYIGRGSILKTIKLFTNYGYCRAGTILLTKNLFISKRHFFTAIFLTTIFILLIGKSYSFIFLMPFLLLLINIFGEIFSVATKSSPKYPFFATICQFAWIFGFIWRFLTIFNSNQKSTNFLT